MKVFLFEFKDFSESSPECKPPSWQSRNPNDRCASQEPESVFFIKVLLFLTEKSELEEKSITILDFAPILGQLGP